MRWRWMLPPASLVTASLGTGLIRVVFTSRGPTPAEKAGTPRRAVPPIANPPPTLVGRGLGALPTSPEPTSPHPEGFEGIGPPPSPSPALRVSERVPLPSRHPARHRPGVSRRGHECSGRCSRSIPWYASLGMQPVRRSSGDRRLDHQDECHRPHPQTPARKGAQLALRAMRPPGSGLQHQG